MEPSAAAPGITIYIGDPVNAQVAVDLWAANQTVDRYDLTEGENSGLHQLGAPTLFGDPNPAVITGWEHVTPDTATRVMKTAERLPVAAVAAKPMTRKQADAVPDATVVNLDRTWVRNTAKTLFAQAGVRTDRQTLDLIHERTAGNLTRTRSIARICQMAGIGQLNSRTATTLLGTVHPDHALWDVTDQALNGDIAGAIRTAADIPNPVPLVDWFAEQLRKTCVAGTGTVSGLGAAWQQKRYVGWAKRWNHSHLEHAFQTAARLTVNVRGPYPPNPQQAVAVICAALTGSAPAGTGFLRPTETPER